MVNLVIWKDNTCEDQYSVGPVLHRKSIYGRSRIYELFRIHCDSLATLIGEEEFRKVYKNLEPGKLLGITIKMEVDKDEKENY